MQAGHYIPKSIASSLYFDEENVHAQCYRCNIPLLGNSDEYAQRLQKRYGEGILDKLRLKRRESKHWSVKELKELRDKYKSND